MIDIDEKIKLLKAYFLKHPEVVMAFVFGSHAKGQETSESDFDIAVYFRPKSSLLEWEDLTYYDKEDKIWGDIEKIIGLKTDLVVLNRAPSTLAFSIIQDGIPVIIKDRSLYLKFFLTISSAAQDFRELIKDFWAIKQRSMSLIEEDKERLIKIIDFLDAELIDYSKFSDLKQRDYELNSDLRRNVERWVENIVNSSIDAAKIILASEKKRIPQTYRGIIQELSLIENFNPKIAEKLAQFVKLRNILAHEYLDIRFNQIKKFIQESEPAYQELSLFIKKLLN